MYRRICLIPGLCSGGPAWVLGREAGFVGRAAEYSRETPLSARTHGPPGLGPLWMRQAKQGIECLEFGDGVCRRLLEVWRSAGHRRMLRGFRPRLSVREMLLHCSGPRINKGGNIWRNVLRCHILIPGYYCVIRGLLLRDPGKMSRRYLEPCRD